MQLYLLKYNNYFNRRLKKESTANSYMNYVLPSGSLTINNFVPGDGLNTSQVINWSGDTPDYVIAQETDGSFTRWFVIESDRLMGGQFKLNLHRDVLAEYWDDIKDSPAKIHRAWLPVTHPLIFNPENISVNEILDQDNEGATLLKDETQIPWIVAYLNRSMTTDEGQEYKRVNAKGPTNIQANYTFSSIDDFDAAVKDEYISKYELKVNTGNAIQTNYYTNKVSYTKPYTQQENKNASYYQGISYYRTDKKAFDDLQTITNTVAQATGYNLNTSAYTYDKKYVSISGILYRVTIKEDIEVHTVSALPALDLEIKSQLNTNTIVGNNPYSLTYYVSKTRAVRETITGTNIHTDIYKATQLKDAPYNAICFPYPINSTSTGVKIGTQMLDFSYQAQMNMATALSAELGTANVFDVQVLPYCPVRDLIVGNFVQIDMSMEHSRFEFIYDESTNFKGIFFYMVESSGSFDIKCEIEPADSKKDILANKYRLKAPNYNSAYDLNVYENGGISYFNVDFTYLPYQPWIKINPNFNWLNGNDLDDDRGLILSGNYSITNFSNAFTEYQLSNINYQAIFDRQVKNMKKTQKYDMIEQLVGAGAKATGVGIATGIATNPILGATIGGASAGAAVADYQLTKLRNKENISYAKDTFDLTLGNLKATPDTLANVTAININYKYFPYIEHYTCTTEEAVAMLKYFEYYSMNVGIVGIIDDYLQYKDTEQFFQAEPIRLDITDDYNMAVEIADELKRGIYITRSEV